MHQTNPIQMFRRNFSPLPVGEDGIVAYIHIGDIHMVDRSHQNFNDLLRIVRHINQTFTSGLNFVYLPGDIADDGSRKAYSAVRACVDELTVPWCGIVGDHDVHEKSFANFREAIADSLYGSFEVGSLRLIRLNVFAEPRPDAFLLGDEQFVWLEGELQQAKKSAQTAVVLMHCYPSELKQDALRLKALLRRFDVRLVDMGHTHYNEVSNDGATLYAATRSTGQIEEGNAGYSLVTFDRGAVSWHFFEPQGGPVVVVTSPADERLLTEANMEGVVEGRLRVRVCVWGQAPLLAVTADVHGKTFALEQKAGGHVWENPQSLLTLPEGVYNLTVTAEDAAHRRATDTVRIVVGLNAYSKVDRQDTDVDNPLKAWKERGLLGTRLGPNKNGRKW
jgi:predicted phosphodiesterase